MILLKMNYLLLKRQRCALLNDKKIRVSNIKSIKSAVFGNWNTMAEKKTTSGAYIETLRKLMDAKCGSIRRLGSAALDMAYVASEDLTVIGNGI